MDKEKDKYEFGRCEFCKKERPLKNGYCIECGKLSDIFKGLLACLFHL